LGLFGGADGCRSGASVRLRVRVVMRRRCARRAICISFSDDGLGQVDRFVSGMGRPASAEWGRVVGDGRRCGRCVSGCAVGAPSGAPSVRPDESAFLMK
jgi:hypothetical protein